MAESPFAGVRAVVEYTVGGRPVVWAGPQHGRPIDLVGSDASGWLRRAAVDQLRAMAGVPNGAYALVFNGEITPVRFRLEDGDPVVAEPVAPVVERAADDWMCRVQLKLMEV